MFEINGNLNDEKNGLKNFITFSRVLLKVWKYFEKHLGEKSLNGPGLYIDNGTCDTGYTPIITPVLGKYVIIKLGVDSESHESKIAYQFSHELMHYTYFVKYGLDKKRADDKEEAICTAASLCVVSEMYPDSLEMYVWNLQNRVIHNGYRKGVQVAEKVNYNFDRLIKEGENVCEEIWEDTDLCSKYE